MSENLTFYVPLQLEQFVVLLPDLTHGPLRLHSRLSFSFQLSIGSFVHSRVDIVLVAQDASVTIVRACHR